MRAANPVFAALRELGLDRACVICVERVLARSLGLAPAAAAQRLPADRGRRGRPQHPARDLAKAVALTAVTFSG
jgi:hypothetical protein